MDLEDALANSQLNNEPYRTMITYKESLDSRQSDPADPPNLDRGVAGSAVQPAW